MKISPFLLLLAGFVVWSGSFLLLYATQAAGCHLNWHLITVGPSSALRLVLLMILVLVVTLMVALVRYTRASQRRNRPEETGSLIDIAVMLQFAALAATLLTYAGVSWLKLC